MIVLRLTMHMEDILSNLVASVVTVYILHSKLRNINTHNITHSLISQNPRERMFVVQISLPIVTNFVIHANHQMRHVLICGVLVHTYATLSRKAKWSGPRTPTEVRGECIQIL